MGSYPANIPALTSPYETGFATGDASGPGNQALWANQCVGGCSDLQITNHGSDWYFTVCAIMGAATLAFMGMSFMKPRADRLFHYITAMITLVACVAYFSMGSNLGQTPIVVEFGRPTSRQVFGAGVAGTREIFYVRYIDWFVTTPLLLLDLLLTAGMPWPTILITLVADEVMIVTGLVGALTRTSYKWGYYTFAMLAFFYVLYSLAITGRGYANALGREVSRTYNMCGVLTLFIWCLYPIAWGCSEGGNVIHPDSEAVFYGILDLIAKPVFGTMLIIGHRPITSEMVGLRIWDYSDPNARPGAGLGAHEKYAHGSNGATNGHNGVTNGTNATTATTAPATV